MSVSNANHSFDHVVFVPSMHIASLVTPSTVIVSCDSTYPLVGLLLLHLLTLVIASYGK